MTASRLFNDDRVRAAIAEEWRRRIDTSKPAVMGVVQGILHDPEEKAPDRLRAAAMLWDRSRPIETKHKIDVENHVTHDERDMLHYRAMKKLGMRPDAFVARFGINGLSRIEAMVATDDARTRTIDGDAEVLDVIEVEELPIDAQEVEAADEEVFP